MYAWIGKGWQKNDSAYFSQKSEYNSRGEDARMILFFWTVFLSLVRMCYTLLKAILKDLDKSQ